VFKKCKALRTAYGDRQKKNCDVLNVGDVEWVDSERRNQKEEGESIDR